MQLIRLTTLLDARTLFFDHIDGHEGYTPGPDASRARNLLPLYPSLLRDLPVSLSLSLSRIGRLTDGSTVLLSQSHITQFLATPEKIARYVL